MEWNFDANDVEERSFDAIPVGDYRVRIKSVEAKTSKNGNPTVKLTLEVSGQTSYLWPYITCSSNSTKTNTMLKAFFNSFGMKPDMNENNWVGKVGAARVKHEIYNGETQARIAYFLPREKQETMTPWVEPNSTNAAPAGFSPIDASAELPF